MRRFLQIHRWATVLAMGLLLFATSGTMLSRMTCLLGGHSVLSIGIVVDCCPAEEEQDGSTIEAACCDLTQAKLEMSHLIGSEPCALPVLIAVSNEAPQWAPGKRNVAVIQWLDSRPPPQEVPDRLAAFGTYLI